MTHMYFIDTSVLLDVLDVPNHCTNQNKTTKIKLAKILKDKCEKVAIPLAVVIETGNFINHIKNQDQRNSCEDRFIDILEHLVDDNQSSWVLSEQDYTAKGLEKIIGTTNDFFPSKVGIGDAFIIEAYHYYCSKIPDSKDGAKRCPTEIWSYDKHINYFKNY